MFEKFFQRRRERKRQRIIDSMSEFEKVMFDSMMHRAQDWQISTKNSEGNASYYTPGDVWLLFSQGHLELRLENPQAKTYGECRRVEFSSEEVRALFEFEYRLLVHRIQAIKIAVKKVSP